VNSRLHKARRILSVQVELDRLAEWRLSELERQEAALKDRRRDLLGFFDGESAFVGLFAAMLMRRLQSLDAAAAALAAEMQAQADRRLEERGRMRCAERIVQSLQSELRRTDDLRSLAEAIEIAVSRQTSGSGKTVGSD